MDKGLIPRRYAKALFEVGAERGDNARFYLMMQALAEAFTTMPQLAHTVANPFVGNDDKSKLLMQAVSDGDAAPESAVKTYADFLRLLEKNGRIDMIREIALAFIDLYRQKNHIYRVQITSAAPLSNQAKERLQNIIQAHIGEGTMEYRYDVDPALIGGFTVQVDSQKLDASVSNQLKQLRRSLID